MDGLVLVLAVLWGVGCVVGLLTLVVFRLEGGFVVVVLAVLGSAGCMTTFRLEKGLVVLVLAVLWSVVGLLAPVVFRLEGGLAVLVLAVL